MPQIPEEELRSIFRRFDEDGSGAISSEELQSAMRLLGVKVSPNSAKKVLKVIDTDNNGTVEWEEFYAFFSKVSDPEEVKTLLSAQNQRFFEYKQLVETDSFAKTFLVPPDKGPLRRLDGHSGDIEHVAWLPDNKLISGDIEGDLIVWNTSKEAKVLRPSKILSSEDDKKSIYSMAVSQDGKYALTGYGCKDNNLQLWDIEKAESQSFLAGQAEALYGCAMASDGRTGASGSKSGQMCLHDLKSGAMEVKWKGHESVVHSIDFMPDSSRMTCSASSDGEVRIFDARNLGDAKPSAKIEDAAASGTVYQALWWTQHKVVSCGDDYCMKSWDIRKPDAPISSFFGHSSVCRAICLSPDKRFLVSGTSSGSVRVWLTDELSMVYEFLKEINGRLTACKTKQDKLEEALAEGTLEDPSELMDARRDFLETEEEAFYYEKVKEERLCAGCSQAKLSLDGSTATVAALAWKDLDDGKAVVACGSQDTSIRLYEVDTTAIDKLERWEKD